MAEQKYCDICAQIKKGSFKPSNPEMIFGSWADVCRNTLKIHTMHTDQSINSERKN